MRGANQREGGEVRYLAVIGDLQSSRERTHRRKTQEYLEAWLDEWSSASPGVFAARPNLTAGDEVQCLLREPAAAMWFVQELSDRLHGAVKEPGYEHEMVFGLGWGALSVGAIPEPPAFDERVWMLDGPCFHLAREALQASKAEGAWLRCRGLSGAEDEVVCALFDLMWAIRSGWTAGQSVITYDRRHKETQRELAELRRMSPSAVSQHLKAAHFSSILAGERAVEAILRSYAAPSGARAGGV